MSKSAQASGRLEHIKWSAPGSDFMIAALDDGTVFKGFMPHVYKGDAITIHGSWRDHPKYGRQIEVKWYTFDAPNECDKEQLEIAETCKFLFDELGLEKRGEKIFQAFKGEAKRIILNNPYMMAFYVQDVGFQTADKIAKKIGIETYDPRRVEGQILLAMYEATQTTGHTFKPWQTLIEESAQALQLDYEFIEEAITNLTKPFKDPLGRPQAPRLVVTTLKSQRVVYTRNNFIREIRLAERVAELLSRKLDIVPYAEADLSSFESQGKVIRLSDEQEDAVRLALASSICIITGGPGVGKTTIILKIVSIIEKAGMRAELCSFTGKAARRLTQITDRTASTIHKLLDFNPRSRKFKRSEKSPITSDFIICDETSMVNLEIGHALFTSLSSHTRLVLVGDVDQIPPIGAGSVFRDLVASGRVPTIRLEKIFRQDLESSLIIRGSRDILQKRLPVKGTDPSKQDLFTFTYSTPEKGIATIVDLMRNKVTENFDILPKDVQVLAAEYKGPTGINAINFAIQRALRGSNPTSDPPFLISDRVIFSGKNDYDAGIMNGDTGVVIQVQEGRKKEIIVTVDIDGIEYRLNREQWTHFRLAYAISIHKCQGSEYPAVIVVAAPGSRPGFFNRNMLYTAITRGKRVTIIVTPAGEKALEQIARTDERRRNSWLLPRLEYAIDGKSTEMPPASDELADEEEFLETF